MWPKRQKNQMINEALSPSTLEPHIASMGYNDLEECWLLDQICFADTEPYDRDTFRYLLSHTQAVCYKAALDNNQMAAFVVGLIEPDGIGHVIALGVDPEHRRKSYGRRLMKAIEDGFYRKGVRTVRLEVRSTNEGAQKLYFDIGYMIVRHLPRYYSNGDDGYLMVKNLG